MILILKFLMLGVINGLIVWLSNLIFPARVVLGTGTISLLRAIIQSAVVLALVNILGIIVLRQYEKGKNRKLEDIERGVIYFLLNTVAVWVIARLAVWVGMGISSWLVAVAIGAVLTAIESVVIVRLGD